MCSFVRTPLTRIDVNIMSSSCLFVLIYTFDNLPSMSNLRVFKWLPSVVAKPRRNWTYHTTWSEHVRKNYSPKRSYRLISFPMNIVALDSPSRASLSVFHEKIAIVRYLISYDYVVKGRSLCVDQKDWSTGAQTFDTLTAQHWLTVSEVYKQRDSFGSWHVTHEESIHFRCYWYDTNSTCIKNDDAYIAQ